MLSGNAMNVSVLSRSSADFERSRTGDINKLFHSAVPELHQFDRAREYTRALNAVKTDKLFAKPFLYAIDGHRDGIISLSTIKSQLNYFASGSADGNMRIYNLTNKRLLYSIQAHRGFVRSICTSNNNSTNTSNNNNSLIYSCGDSTVKLWSINLDSDGTDKITAATSSNSAGAANNTALTPINSYLGSAPFNSMDCHYKDDLFVTAGTTVDLYDPNRSTPIHSFSWGCESINTVKFNRVEHNLLLSSGSDRSIVLYDCRTRTPVRKLIMNMQTNSICWNPQIAYQFTTGNEDHNAYTFDSRSLDHSIAIHQDHVAAIMSVDYSPTGKEIVTGSYDRTIRLFNIQHGHSRDIYHTKRMQRVFAVQYTADNRYILSGSDDCNIRLWKSVSTEKLSSAVLPRERTANNYKSALTNRFQHSTEIKSIIRHKHQPKAILNAKLLKAEIRTAQSRKDSRVRQHSKSQSIKDISVKKKAVRKEIE